MSRGIGERTDEVLEARATSVAACSNADSTVAELVDVHKSFGSQVVLDGLNLTIERAKTTVVLGPSGCGKSVLLKHLIGLLRPDSGEVHVLGTRVDQLDERALTSIRLRVAMLFQMGALFDSMSVAQNIEFPLIEHTRFGAEERRDRIARALRTVDLDGTQSKLPVELSGGQRKRVALARALVLDPEVVLFDEPTTGLDPIRSDGINELILKLKREMGVTNIVVTHDLQSAKKIADHVVMLHGGTIAAQGTFADLEASSNPRVQQFLAGRYGDEDVATPADVASVRVRVEEAAYKPIEDDGTGGGEPNSGSERR